MPQLRTAELCCPTCNNTFLVEPCNKSIRKYCSRTCASKAKSGSNNPNWKGPILDKVCIVCEKPFRFYRGQLEKFCSKTCYDTWVSAHKPCSDCGHGRCKKHERLRQAKWRREASKKELKARSMQVSYKSGTGKTLTLAEARALIAEPPTCIYCKKPIKWQELSIDHKIPKSRGGSNDSDNLCWVDLSCNMMKGNLLDTEFIGLLQFLEDKPDMLRLLSKRLKLGGFAFRR